MIKNQYTYANGVDNPKIHYLSHMILPMRWSVMDDRPDWASGMKIDTVVLDMVLAIRPYR